MSVHRLKEHTKSIKGTIIIDLFILIEENMLIEELLNFNIEEVENKCTEQPIIKVGS